MASDRHRPHPDLDQATAVPFTTASAEAVTPETKLPLAVQQTVHRLLMQWAIRLFSTATMSVPAAPEKTQDD
jgi:amino acid permease